MARESHSQEWARGGRGWRRLARGRGGRGPEDDAERAVDFEAGEPGDQTRLGVVGQQPVSLQLARQQSGDSESR